MSHLVQAIVSVDPFNSAFDRPFLMTSYEEIHEAKRNYCDDELDLWDDLGGEA